MILISPTGRGMSERDFMALLHQHNIFTESVFRRHEMNEVIPFTQGLGVDVGCGLSKIHAQAIGVDRRLGPRDIGYPFGAQIKATGEVLPWFADDSMDFVFSSHCLEHIANAGGALREWARVLKPEGRLVLILPDKRKYPNIGTPGANPDHKHDFAPWDLEKLMDNLGFEILRIDTLSKRLQGDSWATWEAPKFGHKDLNFSFEVVANKAEKAKWEH